MTGGTPPSARKPRLLVMAGGTGGHIMPGLAVAQALRARGWEVSWLGNPDAMEGRLVPPQGIELNPLRFAGLRGKGPTALLKLPLTLGRACVQARRHLRRLRPDVVLGMGGYVAFPGGLMARLGGVPLVLHEQNAVAGMTNRALARVARRVLTGFPGALAGETTGNPVRAEFAQVPPPAARYAARSGPLRILVVGGSLGAQALNDTVPRALALLRERQPGQPLPQVVHQAGEKHLAQLEAAYRSAGVAAECRSFIADMAQAYGEADIVICRAGAMTVAEIATVGVAALFVPFPHAVDDHQTRNASYLVDAGAAWLRQQRELTPAWLADWLQARTRNESQATAERARALAQPHATERIADVCAELAEGPSS
ncbi:undecaprenyldiphospho-muramoylpentapeptide beta-N-acetylglucosaminyltransferase [Verticiella sediminum]|uniref:UDP-N-acetylglucosamine--N-acetylmuramyl-(pentapeptide) pyrophosphoryl-undecaprenol N-acetylglucosamine transferase n=1 Tax=Verticiella sediminum TaxID=1247510 RepID=A0A556A8D4_9BURK|nr:undecaprenyldiphospho-muramoylpentapeptide beta-N-acetylglucosaminyltransferase [Verticiella sediminum]TSH89133.1 undecaprenyldiphospho-muramoylpentapeptide beta-N-acetylglucosaminyltransferase [Verticiella sediminum]